MKIKIINTIIIILCLIALIELLINKEIIFKTISYSLNIWVNSLIPSLFPFFVISDILINYNITNYIPPVTKKIFTKIFNISNNIVTIFFLSLISGFPSSARNIKLMLDNNLITKKEGTHTLIFTHFSNPLFILGTVSLFLNSNTLALIILISHYIPNIILGIITRNLNTPTKNIITNNKIISFPNILINSIKKSIDTLLMILGTLSIFLVISGIIINRLNLNIYSQSILKCILEITMGLKSISELNIPNIYKTIISSMAISFGGLSIHIQVLSFIEEYKLSYKTFLISRFYHSILSGIIAFILYKIII